MDTRRKVNSKLIVDRLLVNGYLSLVYEAEATLSFELLTKVSWGISELMS